RNRSMGGQDDDRQRRVLTVDGIEELQAVDAGHAHVGNHRRRPHHGKRGQRSLPAVRSAHAIAGRRKTQTDQLEQIGVVVDEQNVAGNGHGLSYRPVPPPPPAPPPPALRLRSSSRLRSTARSASSFSCAAAVFFCSSLTLRVRSTIWA